MSTLRNLQARFAQALLGQTEEPVLSHSNGMSVYRNNYFNALGEALALSYPCVLRLVGEDFFAVLTRRYLTNNPPRSGNLSEFGGDFDRFIGAQPECDPYPYLVDMARLEWQVDEVSRAPNLSPLQPDQLTRDLAEDPTCLQVQLHPACRLQTSTFPLLEIWEFDGSTEPPELSDGIQQKLLIHRHSFEIRLRKLSEPEYLMLQQLAAGAPLGTAAATAIAVEPVFHPGTFLLELVQANAITSIDRN